MTQDKATAPGDKRWARLEQDEVGYTPDAPDGAARCASCRWFMPDVDGCHIVAGYPDPILAVGRCDRHEPMPDEDNEGDDSDTAMRDERASPPENPLVTAGKWLRDLFAPTPITDGFKVVGNTWLATWSNNFEDLEGEWFPEKAIDDYVFRVDTGVVPPPTLQVYHLGDGFKVGEADWVGRHGHFLLAAGTFDDTDVGQKARDFYARNASDTSLSHGFTFDPEQFKDGVYHQFNTFEISLLPRGAEANRYTTMQGVKAMTLTDEKRAYIYRIWGEEQGEEMLADLDKAGKALAEAGAAFKSFVSDPREDTAGETQAVKDATDRADASFTQLAGDLIAGQAEALEGVAHIAKEQNALREKTGERFEAFEARITKAVDELRAEMQLRPRKATEAKETALKPESEIAQQVRKDIDEQNTAIDPFWGTKTSKEG